MGINPTKFVYVIQAQLVEDEVFDPYLLAECYTDRDEACERMNEEAKMFLKRNPSYEAGYGLDEAHLGELDLHSTDPNECYSFKLEVLELELYNTLKESKGETE